MKRRILIFGTGGILLAIITGFILMRVGRHMVRTSPDMARKFDKPIPVLTAVAKLSDLTDILGTHGIVRPISMTNLTARRINMSWARVREILVDVGDVVKPGQVLIRFENEPARAALETARSVKDQAARQFERTLEDRRRIREALDGGLLQAARERAEAVVSHAKLELERAEINLERIRAVYDQKLLPKSDLEKAQVSVEEWRMRYKKALEDRLKTEKDLYNELTKAERLVDDARVARSRAREQFFQAEKDYGDTTLASSVSGIIMERDVNAGEIPRTRQLLLAIGRIDQALVETMVDEARMGDIHLGQLADINFSAFPDETFQGEVVRIKPAADPETRSFLVYVKVENPGLRLKPGLSSFVRIKKKHKVLAVPSVAIVNPTGVADSLVFVVEKDGVARLRRVKTGVSAEGMTEIRENLSPGERVVVVGQYNLRDGDRVRIGDEFDEIKSKNGKNPNVASN